MAQIEILYFILCFLAGVIPYGIVLYLLVTRRVTSATPFIVAYGAFTALYAVGFVTAYLSANVPQGKGALWYVLLYIENPILLIAMISVVPAFVHRLVGVQNEHRRNLYFHAAAIMTLLSHVGIAAVGSNFPYSANANLFKNIIVGIVIGYSIVLVLRSDHGRWWVFVFGVMILHDVFLSRLDGIRTYPLVYAMLGLVMARFYHADVQGLPTATIDEALETLSTAGLSAREIEVVRLLIEGKSYQMIADQLFISVNTVKAHVRNIYPKLQVKSRHEIVHYVVSRMNGA